MQPNFEEEAIETLKEIIKNLENESCKCNTEGCGCQKGDNPEKENVYENNVELKPKKKLLDMFGREIMELKKGCLAPDYVKYPQGRHPMIPYPRPPEIIELRSSDLIKGCACLKRNGLQTDCMLKKCQGNKKCTFYPTPVCDPSGLGLPRWRSSIIKRPEGYCDVDVVDNVHSFVKKEPSENQKKKTLRRLKLQMEAEKELNEKIKKEILDKTICKRIDCDYIKRNPRKNVKTQTEEPTENTETSRSTIQT